MSIDKKLRPHFHITGGEGWINDPNGLVYYRGKYHAFYQYYPEATHWGPMHWGHAASDDLTHWETLAPALYPDENDDGCFSGSALVWQDKLWLLYTSFTENGGGENIRQRQALAVSEDGVHFEKLGVVIGENDLPEGYSPCDFRDPKMWKKDDAFYCVVAAKKIGGRGRILLYTSEDLKKWRFVGDLFGKDSKGEMIECPDYIEDKGLLLCCEQFQPAEGKTHLNIHTARYYTGTLDYTTGRFTAKSEGIADYGFDIRKSRWKTANGFSIARDRAKKSRAEKPTKTRCTEFAACRLRIKKLRKSKSCSTNFPWNFLLTENRFLLRFIPILPVKTARIS